jgi:hypothetical protein
MTENRSKTYVTNDKKAEIKKFKGIKTDKTS